MGDLTLPIVTFPAGAAVTLLTGEQLFFSTVSTFMSRCFGDTYFMSGDPIELEPV